MFTSHAVDDFHHRLSELPFMANNPRSHHCQISSAFARISDVMCKMAHYAGRNGLGQKQLIMVADDPEHKRVVSSAKRENLFEVEPCLG